MGIYTRKGDEGKTDLIGKRVSKVNLRIETNGQLDELMVKLAFLIEKFKGNNEVKYYDDLKKIYRKIFTITSMIADINKEFGYMIKEKDISALENEIDQMTEHLPKLKSFIYYTGTYTSMLCHEVRAKVRSVERIVVELFETEELDYIVLIYLNRLSDYFYTLARLMNIIEGNDEDLLKL